MLRMSGKKGEDMSDFEKLKKQQTEEIHVTPGFEEAFSLKVNMDLEEQKKRFEEARLARKKSKELVSRSSSLGSVEAESLSEVLDDKRKTVSEYMPPQFDWTFLEKGETAEPESEGDRTPIPEKMVKIINEIAGWKKVKAETSAPLKEAANALLKAKSDEEAAIAMANVVSKCSTYMDINGSKIFKSNRRKKIVTRLLEEITYFIASANVVYYESFELKFAKMTSQTGNSFADKLSDTVKAAEGSESEEDAIIAKRTRELYLAEEKERVEASRREFEAKEYNRLNGISDLPEEESKKLEFFTEEDRKKQYEELKKQNPDFTEEEFAIYEKQKNAERFMFCPEYNDIFQRSKEVYKKHSSRAIGDFSRDAATILKVVNFDKNWVPISKEDKEKHEWNLKYLNAMDADDFATVEDMVAETVSHTYDKAELPLLSLDECRAFKKEKDPEKKKEIIKSLRSQMDKWVEDRLKNGNQAALIETQRQSLSFDQFKEIHPGLIKYFNDNALYRIKGDLLSVADNYLDSYQQVHHEFATTTRVRFKAATDKKDPEARRIKEKRDKAQNGLMDAFIESMIEHLIELDAHKDDAEVPYEKTEITDEIKNLMEERKLEKDKKERDVIREKILSEEEQKRKEKEEQRDAQKAERLKKEEEKKKEEEERAREAEKEADKTETVSTSKKKRKMKMKPLSASAKKFRRKVATVNREAMKENDSEYMASAKLYLENQTEEKKKKIKENLKDNDVSLTTEERQILQKDLISKVNNITDEKIDMRYKVSMDIKKKIDFRSFERLSDFAAMIGNVTELETLTKSLSESKKRLQNSENAHSADKNAKRGAYPTLDLMTTWLLKIDLSAYDISSDAAIANKAANLEKLARGVASYHSMVAEYGGGARYFEYLKEKKIDGFDGDIGQMALSQIDKLSALSKYYRIRKLVMEDESYTGESHKEGTFEDKRLKKLESMSEDFRAALRGSFRDSKKYVAEDFYDLIKEEEDAVMRIEKERIFTAPQWMYDAFSLTELSDKAKDPNGVTAAVLGSGSEEMYSYKDIPAITHEEEKFKAYAEVKASRKDGKFSGSNDFKGGKSDYLNGISLGDHFDRMTITTPCILSYRRTTAEMKEMLDYVAIQDRADWSEIQKDPEAMAYYESAYKEMAMRQLESIYAAQKRVARTFAPKIMVMHPADLAMQMTPLMKINMMAAIVATNVANDMKGLSKAKKLFEENNKDGRFIFDPQGFLDMESVTANLTFKAQNPGQVFLHLINGNYDIDELETTDNIDESDIQKAIFGTDKTGSKAEKEYNKRKKELEQKAKTDPKAAKELKLFSLRPAYYYLATHPEVFTIKNYNMKTSDGKYILGESFKTNSKMIYGAPNVEGVKRFLDSGEGDHISDEELAAYEKTLKDRGLMTYISKDDPYGLELYKNHLDGLVEKDEDGKYVYNEDGSLKVKSIYSLPDPS